MSEQKLTFEEELLSSPPLPADRMEKENMSEEVSLALSAPLPDDRALPPELLAAMADFFTYDGLKNCAHASLQLSALTKPLAAQKKKKLNALYLGEVLELADWFAAWLLEVQECRETLLRETFAEMRALVRSWWSCDSAQKADPAVHARHAAHLHRVAMHADNLHECMEKLSTKVFEIQTATRTDWPTRFQLSPVSRHRFWNRRYEIVQSAFDRPEAEVSRWISEYMHQWGEVYKGFGYLMRGDFYPELTVCFNRVYQITQLATMNQARLANCFHRLVLFR